MVSAGRALHQFASVRPRYDRQLQQLPVLLSSPALSVTGRTTRRANTTSSSASAASSRGLQHHFAQNWRSTDCKNRGKQYLSSSAAQSAETVRIVEVGPRDGLQNEKTTIPLNTKLELIRRLARTGLTDIEAGSFVAPKWVPQMANSAEVLNNILGHPPEAPHNVNYNFLVPNLRGFENFAKTSDNASPPKGGKASAGSAPITSSQDPSAMPSSSNSGDSTQTDEFPASNTSSQDPNAMPSQRSTSESESSAQPPSPPFTTEISIFAAATEAFSKANTNCTIAESLERFKPIIAAAKEREVRVRGYVSVALGCPFEGPDVSPTAVADLTADLLSLGVDEVSVADTTGMGTAPRTERLLKTLTAAGIQPQDIALHFHDTYGMALVNTLVGLEHGIRIFDSSVAGLGGCPYAKGATGNVATEDLLYVLNSLGMHTGVDLTELAEIGQWISREIGRENEARAGKAILARLKSQK